MQNDQYGPRCPRPRNRSSNAWTNGVERGFAVVNMPTRAILPGFLRRRADRPRSGRSAEQRDEQAPLHWLVPPVLSHHGTTYCRAVELGVIPK
jgi:hypothetical protein